MDSICIIQIEWNIKGDTGHDILAVTSPDCVVEEFRRLVEQEKTETYLNEFFNEDGTLKDEVKDELGDFEDSDTHFTFETKDYEYYTYMWYGEHKPIKKA